MKKKDIKILIACEESQVICIAFRKLGFSAFSCDLKPCSGGHPEWHIQGDAVKEAYSGKYKLMIAHPPCTRLCNSGVRWLEERNLWADMKEGAELFKKFLFAPVPHRLLENPIPHKYAMAEIGYKYNQLIQPHQFGHGETKATCFWISGLPLLIPTHKEVYSRAKKIHKMSGPNRSELRSKTYQGIANAIAYQYSLFLIKKYNLAA